MTKKPFRPPFLPPAIDISPIFSKIIQTREIVARYDEAVKRLPNPEIIKRSFITKEAVLSSKIEGTQATLDEVLLFDAKDTNTDTDEKGNDYQEIFNYRLAISKGKNLLKDFPISENYIKGLHRILLNSVRGKNKMPGEFRDHQVFIAPYGATIEQATFIPPEPKYIIPLFSNLEKYLNQSDAVDPLVKIAIAHYQFETIHPFADGNGRVGRLLIPLFLYEKGVTSYPNIYVSEYLEEHRDVYYRLLREVSEKEAWLPWITFLMDAIYSQTKDTFAQVEKIEKLYKDLDAKMPEVGSIYANKFLEAIFIKPTFMASSIKENVKIKSDRSLYSVISKFLEMGIIRDLTPNSNRGKIYSFPALTKIINSARH